MGRSGAESAESPWSAAVAEDDGEPAVRPKLYGAAHQEQDVGGGGRCGSGGRNRRASTIMSPGGVALSRLASPEPGREPPVERTVHQV